MTRIAPRPGGRRRAALLLLALGLTAAAPAAAQEIDRPRAPALRLRPSVMPQELRVEPADTLLRWEALQFDPWLGVVRRRPPFQPPGLTRLPRVTALDALTWIDAERERSFSRLRGVVQADRLAGRDRGEQGLIPELEDPLRIPEPLAKVFGEGSEFDIQGKLHLAAVGSRATQDPDIRSQLLRQTVGAFDLDLDQILDLKVVGTVGTKLDVAVDFNSSRELESKQLISASYTGTEDEILKKVEVGDIRVTLPPSRFLGSSIGRGSFGAQAVAQLGPVDLSVLGSRKEGQSTDRRLSIAPRGEGVLQEVTLDIKDTQYQDDRFFLLFHPDSLASTRLAYPNPGTSLANPSSTPVGDELNVWLDDANFTNNRERASKRGTAAIDPNDPTAFPEQAHDGFFDLLVEGEDYVVTDGIILQMKRQLNDDEVLAVSYATQGGTRVGSPQDAQELELKLIKPVNPDTLDFTWDYTLRNVYSLREPDIELSSLGLIVYRGNSELRRTFETIDGASVKYSRVFGVTDDAGRPNVPRILRDPFGGPDYLVFPDLRPFFQPTNEAGQPIAIEVPNRRLYFNSDARRTALDDQVYFVEAAYLSRGGVAGEVELGASNVIDGSETITIGGERLVRGEDYQIFYDLGRVVFSDPAGLAERHPDAALDIAFEVAPLFNLAPTSLWGAAGTWNVSRNAVLNSAIVLQDQESLSNRPILGSEPTRTVIAELDGAYATGLPWMTGWLDGLPGVDPDQGSSFSLRGELAVSRPDPNTEGEVFLNDFENIEIANRVPLFFRSWSHGSVPAESGLGLATAAPARWFTFAVRAAQITPNVRGIDRGDELFVLRLEPTGEAPEERRASWRSVQTVLSPTGDDLTRQEFVEFFVRVRQSGGSVERGTIVIDLGDVDEDQVRFDETGAPVGLAELDTEETNPDNRDNNLDVGEDVGLDGVDGADALEIPGDVGNDDFDDTPVGGSTLGAFPANPNGTEDNTFLDTEDDNLNGILDRQDDVLRWTIDLSDPRFEVPGSRTGSGFRQIRLPLVDPDARIGAADLRNVRTMRITFTGVERDTDLEIAGLEIVGSTFLERGIAAADGTILAGQDSDSLRITAINDLENPDYRSPPGVVARQGRADEIAGLEGLVREQSLELGFTGLPPGSRGAIFRPLFDRESYIDYDRMRVWVQGRPTADGPQPSFFVAFGIDTLNVYEYVAPLLDREWEEHVIDFTVFTRLKEQLLDEVGPGGTGSIASEDGRYRVRIATAAAPPPTITEVGQLTIGVENSTGVPTTGSFWIDEWRLTGPVREAGVARYVDVRTTLADLADVVVTWENRGARYRNLGAARNNFTTGSFDVSATLRLEKLLPSDWGVTLPVTYDRVGRDEVPLFRIGSDILLDGEAEREAQARTTGRDVVTFRAFRSRASSNPLVAATLDRLEARVTWRREEFGSVDLDTARSRWDAYLGWRNSFRRRVVSLPLGWIDDLPWPEAFRRSRAVQSLATADLNWSPANAVLSVQSLFEERGRIKRVGTEVDGTADSTRQWTGTAQIAFQPLASMRASFGIDNTRDLAFPETVIARGPLGVDVVRSHTFDFDWTPPVSDWLTPRYSYTSRFTRNHTRETSRSLDSLDLRDFSVTTNQTLTVDLGVGPLLATFLTAPDGPREAWWQRVFEPVRFNRTLQENVSYVQEQRDPDFGFTLGFGDLSQAVREGDPQNVGDTESSSISSGLNLWRGLQVRSTYRETETTRQYLAGSNATTSRTWPDVQARWPNLRPPGFLGAVMSVVTFSSDFERRTSDNRANEQLLSDSERSLWDPVFGVTVTWANGISTDLRANASTTETRTIRGGEIDSRREETSQDLVLNANYDIRPGTRLWVPFPTLWGVEIQRPLRTSLTVARRFREDRTLLEGAEDSALNLETTTTEIRPSLAYEFGRVVSGFAFSYLSRVDEKRDITNKTMSLEAYLDFLF